MEITGKIIFALERRAGKSARTGNDGQELTVSFDIDAREYQGRWFNSIRAWRVMPAQAPGAAPVAGVSPQVGAPGVTMPADGAAQYGQVPGVGVPGPQPQAADGGTDDLPF